MTEFILAIGAFLVAHVIPPMPPVRRFLIELAGRRTYLLAYSILSLVLIGWVIVAARRAPYVGLWPSQPWQALVPLVVMPIAAWFVIAGFVEPNPLSISVRSTTEPALGPAAAITRHPILWGFLLWAASHIPPNGDVVSVILFGFVASLAIAGFFILDRRMRRRLGRDRWGQLSQATSIVPFAALIAGRARIVSWRPLILAAGVAGAFYVWFVLRGHQLLIGIDPLAGLR
jgi:uncharacterized membrane protein